MSRDGIYPDEMGVENPGRRTFLLTTATAVGASATGAAAQESPSGTPTGTPETPPPPPTTSAAASAGPLATDWPTYQHDAANTGAGESEGPVGAVRRRWRTEVPGEVTRQPVVAGDAVYAPTANGRVVALDAYDGGERWRAELDTDTLGALTVAAGLVFAGGGGTFVALDAADGSERWAVDLPGEGAAAATVVGDAVYVAADGVAAYSVADGSQQWRVETDPSPTGAPAVADGTVYVGLSSADLGTVPGAVLALDATDLGRRAWRVEFDDSVAPPAVVDDTVHVATASEVAALDAADGSERWTAGVADVGFPPTVHDGSVHLSVTPEFDPGEIVTLDAADGRERWRRERGNDAELALAGGTLYYAAGDALGATGADGTPRWEYTAAGGGVSFGRPSVAAGLVFVGGDDGAVRALESPRTGARLDIARLDRRVRAARDDGLQLDEAPGLLDEARAAFDEGSYDTAGDRAGEGLAALRDLRTTASAARNRIDRLERLVEEAGAQGFDTATAEQRLSEARTAYENGSYAAASEAAGAGIELLTTRRERAATADERIQELADMVQSGNFGSESPPTRLLEEARGARESGDYEAAITAAERGITAVEARRSMQRARSGVLFGIAAPVADALGRDARLRQARQAYRDGDYQAALSHANTAMTLAMIAAGVTIVGGTLGIAAVPFAALVALEWVRRGARRGARGVTATLSRVRGSLAGIRDGVVRVVTRSGGGNDSGGTGGGGGANAGGAGSTAGSGTGSTTGGVLASGRGSEERDRAARALAEAAEAVGLGAYPDGSTSGGWTDRRVQCPDCSQFANTEGGDEDPPRADCSNCGWHADREWLVDHDHYDPGPEGATPPATTAGFVFPGQWTDRRVQCPECNQFAGTEGGEGTAPMAVCSNCGWVGGPDVLVDMDRYDLDAGDGPVRPSTAALVDARHRFSRGEWAAARESAEQAQELADEEADAVAAIEEAMAAIDDDVPTDEAEDLLAAARAAVADEAFDRGERKAREAERRAGATPEELVEQARDHVAAATEAAERDDYREAVDRWETARQQYEQARDRAAAIGDDPARADATEALAEVDRNLAATRLSRIDDAVSEAYSRLEDEPEAAETAFRTALDDLGDVDADAHPDEFRDVRERARRGVVRAGTVQGRELMEGAEAAFENGEYREAREGFEAAADHLEDVLATAADYDLDDARDEVDALVETCRENAGEARRALFDVDTVEPAVTSADDAIASVAAGVDGGSDEPVDADAGADMDAATDAGDGAAPAARNGTGTTLDGAATADAGRDREPPTHERVEHLGSGGAATVHRVELADGGEAALKTPRMEGTLSAGVMEAFVTEAETWSKLDDHPNVVTVADWGTSPYPWLLLEYLPGGNLADRLPLEPTATREAMVGVCEAVHHAHTRGVAHADLKPENVLFDADDRPKVGDWGLANRLLEGDAADEGLTPAYAAPEQLEDGTVGTATDIYQLGVVTYEALTGRQPFAGEDHATTVETVRAGECEPPTAVDPSLPDAADEVVATAMAVDPDDRYESVVYLRDALEGLP